MKPSFENRPASESFEQPKTKPEPSVASKAEKEPVNFAQAAADTKKELEAYMDEHDSYTGEHHLNTIVQEQAATLLAKHGYPIGFIEDLDPISIERQWSIADDASEDDPGTNKFQQFFLGKKIAEYESTGEYMGMHITSFDEQALKDALQKLVEIAH